jgi:hypothetical protein
MITLDGMNARRYAATVWSGASGIETRNGCSDVSPFASFPRTCTAWPCASWRSWDAATSLEDLRIPPGNRREKLTGDRTGQHSIRINERWRVCFRWKEGDAYDVEIVDYH